MTALPLECITLPQLESVIHTDLFKVFEIPKWNRLIVDTPLRDFHGNLISVNICIVSCNTVRVDDGGETLAFVRSEYGNGFMVDEFRKILDYAEIAYDVAFDGLAFYKICSYISVNRNIMNVACAIQSVLNDFRDCFLR